VHIPGSNIAPELLSRGDYSMASIERSVYEQNMAEEPAALLCFADTGLPAGLASIDFTRFDRIILTGMGGSDSVTIPFEILLARRGLPVWRLSAGRLLEMLELVTEASLLVVTSQSGRSGEIVALLEQMPKRPGLIIGVTNDPTSALASAADHVILLHCGDEATVATKSYANTLAAFHRMAALAAGRPDNAAVQDIKAAAAGLEVIIQRDTPAIDELAARALAGPRPRLALIGAGPDAATAISGALVLKEAAKVAAEGYVGGAFRHGPLELAGPGLTALLFGTGSTKDVSLNPLSRDLAASGSIVASMAPSAYEKSELITIAGTTELERLLQGMYVVQLFSVALGRASGIVPGAFNYGRKVTDQL
jgi:glucosamine--fructose-6-phosphate aminotransferase (isomerizing)